MIVALGHNPLRYNCKEKGACYNRVLRPKIEVFASDLPRKCAFSDIDAVADVSGRFLFIEWKTGASRDIGRGQEILFKNLTLLSDKITVVVVFGNAETMEVTGFRVMFRGQWTAPVDGDLDALRARIRRWSALADAKAKVTA